MQSSASALPADGPIAAAIERELDRQKHQIELIASENIVSADAVPRRHYPVYN